MQIVSLVGYSKEQNQINEASLARVSGNGLGLQGDTCGCLLAEFVMQHEVCLENLQDAQLNSMTFRKPEDLLPYSEKCADFLSCVLENDNKC